MQTKIFIFVFRSFDEKILRPKNPASYDNQKPAENDPRDTMAAEKKRIYTFSKGDGSKGTKDMKELVSPKEHPRKGRARRIDVERLVLTLSFVPLPPHSDSSVGKEPTSAR